MGSIHPTAIIDPQADIDTDVVIGPHCIIEGKVSVGSGTHLIGHVYLRGPTTIGTGNQFYPFVCVGFEPQDLSFEPSEHEAGVDIGHDNVLRESVTVHRATGSHPTQIGDRNFLMANSHLGHDVVLHNDCTLANGALLGGHVELADSVFLGGNAAVHQFCRVGRLSIVAGIHGVSKDLPPFCVVHDSRRVGSLNRVGLRRAGYREHIKPLQRAFDLLYRYKLSNLTAVEQIEQELGHDPLCLEFTRFVRQTKRGLTPYASSNADSVTIKADNQTLMSEVRTPASK